MTTRHTRATTVRAAAGAILLASAAACAPTASEKAAGEAEEAPVNTLTEAEREAGWRLLFDGRTTDGWRGFRQESMPDGWRVEDGTLARVAPAGDIITVDRFRDFELSLEWRIEPGSNSGIFFRVSEDADEVWHTGPEMQILDDELHPDGRFPAHTAGSNYGIHVRSEDATRPVGEWNEARILVHGNHVEHWLNGVKVVEYELGSEDWEARVAASKFVEHPRYGREPEGHIALQDHDDPVWFRNIKIREIP